MSRSDQFQQQMSLWDEPIPLVERCYATRHMDLRSQARPRQDLLSALYPSGVGKWCNNPVHLTSD